MLTKPAAMDSADRPATRFATRCAFLTAGMGLACWAPLVPYAKSRLEVDDGTLGVLLLALGIGSLIAMPVTGVLSTRAGSRWIIVGGGLGLAASLPFLAVASSPSTLGMALFVFGASMGSLDVAMNIHAVEVERAARRPIMSGFHALFSIGGFAGSGMATSLLSARFTPLTTAISGAAIMAAVIGVATPFFLACSGSEQKSALVLPRGIVLLLSSLAAIMFLIEGALLDWSALLMIDTNLASPAQGGLGYMLFAVAMTVGRLVGDRVAMTLGSRRLLFWGGSTAFVGLCMLLGSSIVLVAMSGFVLIGLGASNIVPVLFRLSGAQRTMPGGLAVAAMTTSGYAGVLIGPAAVGFAAHVVGLYGAFWILTALMALVPLLAGAAADET